MRRGMRHVLHLAVEELELRAHVWPASDLVVDREGHAVRNTFPAAPACLQAVGPPFVLKRASERSQLQRRVRGSSLRRRLTRSVCYNSRSPVIAEANLALLLA